MRAEAEDKKLESAMRTCDELLRLSQEQRSAIAEEDLGRLNELLEQRERLISILRMEDVNSRAHASFAARLREVLHLDEQNQRALRVLLERLRTQLASVGHGRQALHHYAYLNPQVEPVYIDRRR